MPRPKRHRRILTKPPIKCFKPETESDGTIKVTLDEFEAIRLKDYHNIKQKKAAQIMGISQPTFHRIITSARSKIAKALVEGKTIILKGGDYITDKKRYKCLDCQFEWISPKKEYKKCPDCGSENITIIEEMPIRIGMQRGIRRGMRAGPPRACKCTECGYEIPKTPGVPCRTERCPKCGGIMCATD
ncbi:MAG: DUF134 domain-containing protein [Methanothermobacter tenebrarum]